jgi:hypothetical protein
MTRAGPSIAAAQLAAAYEALGAAVFKVMVDNGQYFANPRDGRYLKRKIGAEVLNGPAL